MKTVSIYEENLLGMYGFFFAMYVRLVHIASSVMTPHLSVLSESRARR